MDVAAINVDYAVPIQKKRRLRRGIAFRRSTHLFPQAVISELPKKFSIQQNTGISAAPIEGRMMQRKI